jgi:hypothetical protein
MKVDTDLKAGNFITDAVDLVNQGVNEVTDFVSTADQQARAFTTNVTSTAQSIWNSLTGWVGL